MKKPTITKEECALANRLIVVASLIATASVLLFIKYCN